MYIITFHSVQLAYPPALLGLVVSPSLITRLEDSVSSQALAVSLYKVKVPLYLLPFPKSRKSTDFLFYSRSPCVENNLEKQTLTSDPYNIELTQGC